MNLAGVPMTFASNRPSVLRVDRRTGRHTALAAGIATISVTVGEVTASKPFVVT